MSPPKRLRYEASVADNYDAFRGISEGNLMDRLRLIASLIGSVDGRRVDFLDIGCGTGRYTIPIATRLGYEVTGADSSQEMLERAMEKEGADRVRWQIQDAHNIAYPNDSFDCIFMSHLLHHLDNPQNSVKQMYRILREGGVIINRYGDPANLFRDPEHFFFPETVPIDSERVLSKAQTEDILKGAGFVDIRSIDINQDSFVSPHERLNAVEQKYCSVLHLLDDDAFVAGVERFKRYLQDTPNARWITLDNITFTVGYKRKPVEPIQ